MISKFGIMVITTATVKRRSGDAASEVRIRNNNKKKLLLKLDQVQKHPEPICVCRFSLGYSYGLTAVKGNIKNDALAWYSFHVRPKPRVHETSPASQNFIL